MNVPDDRARRKALRLELVGRRQAMDAAALVPLHAALETRVEALLTQLKPASVGFTWPYRGEFDRGHRGRPTGRPAATAA